MNRKYLAAIGLTGGLVAGGAAGFALGAPGLVGAQEDAPATEAPPNEELQQRAQDHIREALAPLLENGTLDQAQVDAVIGALEDARPEGKRGHHGKGFFRGGLDNVAEVLNLSAEDLQTALRDGQTLAQVAEAQGVDVQSVIDTMVADANARIDEAVANGRIDETEAEAKKAEVVERITTKVNEGRQHDGPRGRRGPGGPDGQGEAPDAPAEEDAEGSVLTS